MGLTVLGLRVVGLRVVGLQGLGFHVDWMSALLAVGFSLRMGEI